MTGREEEALRKVFEAFGCPERDGKESSNRTVRDEFFAQYHGACVIAAVMWRSRQTGEQEIADKALSIALQIWRKLREQWEA